jgi:hypothetical protein
LQKPNRLEIPLMVNLPESSIALAFSDPDPKKRGWKNRTRALRKL